MTKSARRIVTFELPKAHFDALQEDAAVRGSNSHHQRGRDILIDYLTNRQMNEISESVASLDSHVAYLGELTQKVAYSVIVHAAGKTSKEANEWIREHMPSKSS